jgi:HEAT repeat protein
MNDPHNFGFLSLALADDDWWIVWQAAQLLGRLGDARAVPLLIARLNIEGWWTFDEIAGALQRLGDESAVRPLVEVLRSGAQRNYASAAATLGHLGGAAFPALCGLLHEPEPHLRWWAQAGLRYIGAPAFDFVAETLHDEDKTIRSHAIHILADIDESRAIPVLIPALDDPDPDVRWDAAQTLGRIGDERIVPALSVVAESDPAISSHDTHVPGVAAIAARAIHAIRYRQQVKIYAPIHDLESRRKP